MDLEHDLSRLADRYRDQGYQVAVNPRPDQLPSFAHDFRVEIVGRRGTEGVLVAVRRNRDELAADGDMPGYAEITAAHPGWRFDFAILEPEMPNAREARDAQDFSGDDITHSLEEARELNRTGFPRFAVVAAWAGLEAAMRMRLRSLGRDVGWGSPPREMLKELYSAGALSPDEFHRVEGASRLRNQIVHGFAARPAEAGTMQPAVVQVLSDVARRLVHESQPAAQSA